MEGMCLRAGLRPLVEGSWGEQGRPLCRVHSEPQDGAESTALAASWVH